MSGQPGMTEKFNFRGSPSSTQDFHMLAVLKNDDGQIDDFKTENSENFEHLEAAALQEKYFFLCLNQYQDSSNNHLERLYWSSDPDDFQKNDSYGYRNQGVARINLSNINGNNSLRYRSSFEGTRSVTSQTVLKNFGNSMDRLSETDQPFPVTFTLKGSNKNLPDTEVYYSLPYSVINTFSLNSDKDHTTYNNIEWIFRKIEASPDGVNGVSGIAVGKPTTTPNASNIFNFVDITSLNTNAGTQASVFNYGSSKYYVASTATGPTSDPESDIGFSVPDTDSIIKDYFPNTNSLMRIKKATDDDSTVIRYSSLITNGNGIDINIQSNVYRGLLGTNFALLPAEGLSIYFNERNSSDCFTTLNNATNFSDIFDIYLIPTYENAIFPGGYLITNTQQFPTTCHNSDNDYNRGLPLTPFTTFNLKFFSHVSRLPFTSTEATNGIMLGDPNTYVNCNVTTLERPNIDKEEKYKEIYNLLMFSEVGTGVGSLNPNFWSTTGETSYPHIAKEGKLKTFYTWDTIASARQSFMYDYCVDAETCGFCFGKNNSGELNCKADSSTRKNAVTTTSSNVKQPLTGTERANGTHSQPGSHLPRYAIIIIICVSVLVVILIIVFWWEKRKKRLRMA